MVEDPPVAVFQIPIVSSTLVVTFMFLSKASSMKSFVAPARLDVSFKLLCAISRPCVPKFLISRKKNRPARDQLGNATLVELRPPLPQKSVSKNNTFKWMN